jgi:hypothetical protein
MRATPRFLMTGLATVAAIGISSAPAAAESSCQDVGQVTVCAQGTVGTGDSTQDVPFGPLPDINDLNDTGCVTQYGTYQNCNASH